MTGNEQLAADLIRQADDHLVSRKALLVAAAALGTTTTIPAARKAIADPDAHIPPAIRSAALELLGRLAEDVPAQGGAAQEGST